MMQRRAQLVCGIGLMAGVIGSYALTLLTPSLLKHHSLLLETLSASTSGIIIGGATASVGRESIVLVVLAPLVVIALYDVFFWWAGRLWGNQVLLRFARTPRSRRWIARSEGWVARHGVLTLSLAYFLPVPSPALYLLSGASGMGLGVFLLGDAIGTLLWSGFLAALGWMIGKPALDVVNSLNHYANIITVVLVVLLVLRGSRGRRGARPRAARSRA